MQNIFLIIVTGLILISMFTKDNTKKQYKITEPIMNVDLPNNIIGGYALANLNNTTYSTTKLGWIENSRNNKNYKKYPPCFNLSKEAQRIYKLLKYHNLVEKHKVLLEVYSMLLCQISYLQSKICVFTMLPDRLKDLESFGANRYIKYYKNLTKYVNKQKLYSTTPISLDFLNKSLFLIDKEIDQIVLPKDIIDSIKKLNNTLCSYVFQIIASEC